MNSNLNNLSNFDGNSLTRKRNRGPKEEIVPEFFNPNFYSLKEIVYKHIEIFGPKNLEGVYISDFAFYIIKMNHYFKLEAQSIRLQMILVEKIKGLHKEGLIALTKDGRFGIFIPNLPEKLPIITDLRIKELLKEVKDFNTYDQAYSSIKKYSDKHGLSFSHRYNIGIIVYLMNNVL